MELWQDFLAPYSLVVQANNRASYDARTMKTNYLNYYTQVLEKVSFDRHLLQKEYSKALRSLDSQDTVMLVTRLKEKGIMLDRGSEIPPGDNRPL